MSSYEYISSQPLCPSPNLFNVFHRSKEANPAVDGDPTLGLTPPDVMVIKSYMFACFLLLLARSRWECIQYDVSVQIVAS